MSERAWIAKLRARLEASANEHVVVGIGDDAAVVRFGSDVVLSVDEQREGAHFRRPWLSLQQLGFRSCAVSLSDLAAMGAAPRAMLLAITWPQEEPWAEGMQLIEGAARAAGAFGAPIVGGNLCRGDALGVSVTALGAAPPRPILRSGARPGDGVFVTGPLGAAAIGWRSLERGVAGNEAFAERWGAPTPRFDRLEQLAAHATSAIDISDGLRSDAESVAVESGVRITLDADAVPLADGSHEAAKRIDERALELAFTGGEDYELLFTARAESLDGSTRIGVVEAGSGVHVRGLELPGDRRGRGHDHFAPS